MFTLYRITNLVNNKSYIGLTSKQPSVRWKQHLRHAFSYNTKTKLYNSMRKYGEECFDFEVLLNGLNKKQALDGEVQLIEFFNTLEEGLNSTPGGDHLISSEWQKQNQLKRVKAGTHPFVGGEIQRKSSKKRWQEGTNSLQGLNEKRLLDNTHNLLGDNNPTKLRAKEGKHHNQKPAWLNTKANTEVWLIADKVYNKWKETKWSYRNLEKYFNFNTNINAMVKKFKTGWIPQEDPAWNEWAVSLSHA